MEFLERAERRINKVPIPVPNNFGYNYPKDSLYEMCEYVIASNYTIFPRSGGLEDQDPLFIADLRTYEWLQQWAEQEVKGTEREFREEGRAKGRKLAFDEL